MRGVITLQNRFPRRGRAVLRGRSGRRTLRVVKDLDTQRVITVELS